MATKKKPAPRAKTAKKNTRKAGAPPRQGRVSEVTGVVLMALGVFSGYLIWMVGGDANATLSVLRDVLRGVAGMISSVMPIMLCAMGIIMMFVGKKRIRPMRAFMLVLEAILLCGVWHLFSAEAIEQTMLTDNYRDFIVASYKEGIKTSYGAGALGAMASWHLFKSLDVWGGAIVLIAGMLVIAVGLSRMSVREVGERISETISGGMDEYRERRQVRGREKAEMRARALERSVAREEQERLRREAHQRAIEEARLERENVEKRISELQIRRDKLTVNPNDADVKAALKDDISDIDDDMDMPAVRRTKQTVNPRAKQTQTAQHHAQPERDDAQSAAPVEENSLEQMKSRHRGDQEAYKKAMRQRMAQEGVPMFLDKRVPGRIISSAAGAPIKGAQMPGVALGEASPLVFEGYDEPGKSPDLDSPAYTAEEFEYTDVPQPQSRVLELDGLDELPDTSRVDELLSSVSAANVPSTPSQQDVTMRPLRNTRDYDMDTRYAAQPPAASQPETVDMNRVAHSTASVKRIVGSKMVYQAAAQTSADAQEQREDYRRPDYAADYATQADADTAARTQTSSELPENALPGRGGMPFGAPLNVKSAGFTPAPGSAYAVATDYENGMPFERYADPDMMAGDMPVIAGLENAAPVMRAAAPASHGWQPRAAQPIQHPAAAQHNEARTAQADEFEDDDDSLPIIPDIHEKPAAPEKIAFDGYSGEGGVNEEIAIEHTPEIVPETAQKVAMYTPVSADLDRGYSGTRLDGTPIKMPKPAMEEIEQPKPYFYPPIDLLEFSKSNGISTEEQRELDAQKAVKLENTLQSFGIQASVVGVSRGPAVTRFELTPAPGVRVSKISGLADDIALNLAATTVRIEAPIPGKSAVGIELPNEHREMVTLRDVLDSPEAAKAQSKLAVALGKDNAGKLVLADIAKMPHVLIAGATGSGKSVCINTIIMSIIYRSTPDEVRLILVDPKVVELSVYNGVPHLLVPVVTDPKKAASALNWAVLEMTERYQKFAERGVRDIKGFNHNLKADEKPLPQIVIIIDELADLMMVAPGEVEDAICRLAQLARAAGMHLVIATQRPSVNVITGVIKANIPSRIAFTVASQIDSRTILDGAGAEKLLGRGDMLFFPNGVNKPQRVQGANVTDEEVHAVTEFIKSQHEAVYNPDIIEQMEKTDQPEDEKPEQDDDCDELLPQAIEIAVELGQVSISMLQRRMRIGYARAGRIVDEMTQRGIVGAADGAKPRPVLMSREEFKRLYGDDAK